MALAQRQLAQQCDANEWITLEDAAALLGEPLRTMQFRANGAYAKAGQARLASPPSGRGKPVWWIARSIDARLSRAPDQTTRADLARESLLSKYPAHYVERAYRKARWVDAWRQRASQLRLSGQTDLDIAGAIVGEARKMEGPDFKISVRSLQAWHSAMNEIGENSQVCGVAALIDRYGLGAPGGDGVTVGRSAEAVEYFNDLFRTPLRPSLKYCHGMTLRMAKRSAWSWPASYSATRVWHRDNDDISTTYLLQWGKKAWSKKFMPYLEQDWELVRPGQMYVADHHVCDFWVQYKGTTIRPWLTAIQDCRSRRIVGWTLGPSPHQDAILSAMRMAFKQAVPEVMRLDNGRDFKSKVITGVTPDQEKELKRQAEELDCDWRDCLTKYQAAVPCDDSTRWTGVANELDIDLVFALPYHAWSKGTIERFFGTFENNVGRSMPTYCSNTSDTVPENLNLIMDGYTGRSSDALQLLDAKSTVPTMEFARQAIADWLTVYDHTAHSGCGCDGRTPMEVWQSAESLRTVDEPALDILMSIRGEYRVGANGISMQIGGRKFGFGARSDALRPWVGRDVLIAHDPEAPTRCVAFDVKTRKLIATLEPNERLNPLATIDDMREAAAAIGRERRQMNRATKLAARQSLSASARVNRDLREQAAELRATATDGRPLEASIRPVRTGFEAVSIPAQTSFEVEVPDSNDLRDFLDDPAPFRQDEHDEDLRPINVSDLLEDHVHQEEEDPLSQLS